MAYSMNDETGKQPTANDLTKEFCEGNSSVTGITLGASTSAIKAAATKQVQRLATVSPKYRITYFGHHTCRNILKDEEIITYPGPREEDGILLSFERPRIERNTTDSDSSQF
ncbi:hypothetical protein GH714_035090 [Hevea brasiliensis]|uniref:WRKY domain-containing protein n=1 Tax=Hevea brasiliensis TaxID=3981 RepID=A0A6A6M5I4_HEVBR|nr:hypothetical protein GH714_035090 [Hevea brasiliensis]